MKGGAFRVLILVAALLARVAAGPGSDEASKIPDRNLNDHHEVSHIESHHTSSEHEHAVHVDTHHASEGHSESVHVEAHHDENEHHEEHSGESEGSQESGSAEEAHPNIEFSTYDDIEHMRNFQAISGDLKAYETEYSDCLSEIPDAEFSEARIDQCIGHNFIKVLVDIKYVTMKTMSQGDSRVRSIFVDRCYSDAFGHEEYLSGCDVMERDVLNMLWTGLNFVDILLINSDKYQYEYGRVPVSTFGLILDDLKKFGAEFFELIDEIDSHKEVTVLRLKNYIEDRINLIAEAEHEQIESGDHEETVTHTFDIEEQHELPESHHRKLLPEFQIGSGGGKPDDHNRWVNKQAVAKESNKRIYDKPQTPGVFSFGGMGGQQAFRQHFNAAGAQPTREAFRRMNLGRF